MSRILIIIVTTLISMIADGQDSIFDKKVQQLFFDVDVDSFSPSLVDKFAKVQGIAHKKPRSYLSWAFNGKLRIHTFKFTAQPYLTNRFDTGIIELEVVEIGKEKRLKDITWKLQFDKKEDAVKVFEEIK